MPAESHPRPRFAALELLEIAPAERGWGDALAARLSRRLGLTCRVRATQAQLDLPELPGRDQLDADRLLEAVEAIALTADDVLVAVTGRDMGHPIFTHFFGRARRGGRAVLISTARLDPRLQGLPADAARTLDRAVCEVLHELGHVAGLGHCSRWDCVMRFASTVEALDNRGAGYCVRCAAHLPESLARAGA